MAERNFSLKDQLFNAESLGDLGREYAAGLPGFDGPAFAKKALSGVAERTLMACLDWFADCLEPHLAQDFPTMADQLEAMMPPRLDPKLSDDDFGRFIHAVPGVLAVRHGLDAHRERALDLLYEATQRFSMEFYIRSFLNRWPEETLARLELWAGDENYHVRRLVSEGTRPKLPWSQAVAIGSDVTLPLLDRLHGDGTRFVTRSVANHLNDISKSAPDLVLERLKTWRGAGDQATKELDWMERHALRSLIKEGHAGAMAQLGYAADVPVRAQLEIAEKQAVIGEAVTFQARIEADETLPVLVDYRICFHRPGGRQGEKVFKLKAGQVTKAKPFEVKKVHKLKGNATTFQLHPGPHRIVLQVNGVDRADVAFELVPGPSGGSL